MIAATLSSSALNAEPISNVPQPTKASSHIVSLERTLDEQVQALEISLIQAALTKTEQNKTQAAKLLGLSRQGLIKKIERYQLEF